MHLPNGPCDRRSFLAGGIALLSTGVLTACEWDPVRPAPEGPSRSRAQAVGTTYLYADESGLAQGRAHFVLGALLTSDPDRHRSMLDGLRTPLGYWAELRYSSTDRYKLRFANAVLDHFFGDDDLRFVAGVLGPGNARRGLTHGELYRRLIRESDAAGPVELRLERRTSDGQDTGRLAASLAGQVAGIGLVDSSRDTLSQLTDLLTGSIFGDATRAPRRRGTSSPHPGRQSVKAEIIAGLRDRLGINSLTARRLADHPKFAIRSWRPPFG
jgi:hypothetical protein